MFGQQFYGASLFTKDEIGKALSNFRKERDYLNKLLGTQEDYAKSVYPFNFFQRLFKTDIETIITNAGEHKKYEVLALKGCFRFTESDRIRLEKFSGFRYPYYLGIWEEERYRQVQSLYGHSGRDCYLNPAQAQFVNTWVEYQY